ncbi:MAG: D-alanyl-D-alanine carboxypeptidase [Gammaproteobacteria bacterium]|nr:D-alanyl-D-alanine carboxypeptidase [Gammaproteobacteria bacterium]
MLPPVVSLQDEWPTLVPPAPQLSAKSYILVDVNSGQVLAAMNPNLRLPPASITKLMLAYILEHAVASGNPKLDDIVSVPEVAWATGGSRMFLKPGDKVKLQDLILGTIVDSGNDAAVTIATLLGGTQEAFVGMMNQRAQALGMTNTHFTDVMGLPAPDHYTSARDLGVLAQHVVAEYPQYLSWFGQKFFTYNGIKQANFNRLLFIYPYAQGLKTGSTDAAGYSLVSAAKDPDQNMQLVGVVLGAGSRDQSAEESKALLMYGFRFFKTQLLYRANQTVTEAKISHGAVPQVPVGVSQDFYISYPVSAQKDLKAQVQLNTTLNAPIKQGDVMGTLTITLQKKVLKTIPVVALKDVQEGSWWQSVSDKLSHWF